MHCYQEHDSFAYLKFCPMFHTEPLGDCQFQTLKRTSSAKFQQPETPPPDSLIVPHGNKQK